MCQLQLYRLALRANFMVRGPLVLVWVTPVGRTSALVLVQALVLVVGVWALVPALARQ
jgi:hypothetical protein